jgi:hypothetical protein
MNGNPSRAYETRPPEGERMFTGAPGSSGQ